MSTYLISLREGASSDTDIDQLAQTITYKLQYQQVSPEHLQSFMSVLSENLAAHNEIGNLDDCLLQQGLKPEGDPSQLQLGNPDQAKKWMHALLLNIDVSEGMQPNLWSLVKKCTE